MHNRPTVGHGERRNGDPQRAGPDEDIGQEGDSCQRWRNKDLPAGDKTGMDEHRDGQAPRMVMHPYHEYTVGR